VRAAVLVEPDRIELREIGHPRSDADEALVRVHALGVCGTDQKIFQGHIPVTYPRIMGHEIVGEVVESVATFGAGQRVIVDPTVICGACDRCREGRGTICQNGWLIGRDRDGGFCELISVPTTNLFALPETIDDGTAPLLQVLTTCVHAHRQVDIFPGESVAIIGLGVTGLLHLQLTKLRGAWPIVCVTRSQRKLALSLELGADVTVDAGASDVLEQVRDATHGGADVVIECAGTIATLGLAVRAARPGARILAYGTIAETEGTFPFYDLYYKELALMNARSALSEDFPVAIDAVASGRVQLPPLVSHRLPLDQVATAFTDGGPADALKVIIEV
jgi:L-iditol 2-dehydrogenase